MRVGSLKRMSRKAWALVLGSTVGAVFAALVFTSYAGYWLIYPDFPGFALTNLAVRLTEARVLLLPYGGRVLFVGGNAGVYGAMFYLAMALRLRWKT